MLDEYDPISAQSLKVSRYVLAAIQCYTKVLKEKKMKASHTPLLAFFKKK
jgi:hypothetical protein